jgi:hypothetical protein
MVKIEISYPSTGNFFQSENASCTIFDLSRLIGCQTQEKAKKNWFGKLRHFEWLVKIMIFAKKNIAGFMTPQLRLHCHQVTKFAISF